MSFLVNAVVEGGTYRDEIYGLKVGVLYEFIRKFKFKISILFYAAGINIKINE